MPGELWLGLEQLHKLTSERDYKLNVTLRDFDNKSYTAVYDQFKVLVLLEHYDQSCRTTITFIFPQIYITVNLFALVQVGPGDDYKVTIDLFNSAISSLGDSFGGLESHLNINGMKFSTKYDVKHAR